MDDDEEDMSRLTAPNWEAASKYEASQMAAGQALASVPAAAAPSQGRNNNSTNSLPCCVHRPLNGVAGLHILVPFEPTEDRGGRRPMEGEEEDDDRGEGNDRMAERPEEQPGVSVEVQIGRKLREIGDKFHQDHVELRHQRRDLPVWMRLTVALFGFLFPREAFIPRLRGEQR